MNIRFHQERIFSRWEIKPELGEPAYGYFARLVADEGHSSTRVYANEVGLNGRKVEPEELLHSLLNLPLAEDHKEKLLMSTPVLSERFHTIGNEKLRQKQISNSIRRFCPHCLGENPYHRVWWDVISFKTCPVHGTPIKDNADGSEIKWWWPHFDASPDGAEMADRSPVSNPPDPLAYPLHRMVIQRLSGQAREGVLAEFELFEIIEASMTMSRILASEAYNSLADPELIDIETGFEFLVSNPELQVQRLTEWLSERVPEAKLKTGYSASCAAIRMALSPLDNRILGHIDRSLQKAFARIGKLGRKRTRHNDVERSEKTLREASVALNVPSKALSKFTRKMGFLQDAKWNGDALSFDGPTFEKVKQLVEDLIGLPDTINLTSIPGHEFRFLEKAGLIEAHYGMSIGGTQGPKYLRSDVEKLVQQVRDLDLPKRYEDKISLHSFAKRTGQKQGEIICKILSGELLPDALDLSKVGFRSIYFNEFLTPKGGAAGSDQDVDDLQMESECPVSLWTFFCRQMKAICPTIHVPDLIPEVGSIRSSNGKFAAAIKRIKGNGGPFKLTVEFHPERSARRWKVYTLKKERFQALTEGKWQSTDDGRGVELVLKVANADQVNSVVKTVRQLQRILATRLR